MPEEIFKVGDKVRWKKQALTSAQVGYLIEKLTLGYLGPFKVKEVTKAAPNAGVEHPQIITVAEMSGEMSGFWFEKAP